MEGNLGTMCYNGLDNTQQDHQASYDNQIRKGEAGYKGMPQRKFAHCATKEICLLSY